MAEKVETFEKHRIPEEAAFSVETKDGEEVVIPDFVVCKALITQISED